MITKVNDNRYDLSCEYCGVLIVFESEKDAITYRNKHWTIIDDKDCCDVCTIKTINKGENK